MNDHSGEQPPVTGLAGLAPRLRFRVNMRQVDSSIGLPTEARERSLARRRTRNSTAWNDVFTINREFLLFPMFPRGLGFELAVGLFLL